MVRSLIDRKSLKELQKLGKHSYSTFFTHKLGKAWKTLLLQCFFEKTNIEKLRKKTLVLAFGLRNKHVFTAFGDFDEIWLVRGPAPNCLKINEEAVKTAEAHLFL